jgi:hypothetical protein
MSFIVKGFNKISLDDVNAEGSPYQQGRPYVSLVKNSSNYIELTAHFAGDSYKLVIDSSTFKANTKQLVFCSPIEGILTVDDWRLSGTPENKASFIAHYKTQNDVVANIYNDDVFENGMLFVNWDCVVGEGIDFQIQNEVTWIAQDMADNFPNFAPQVAKMRAKRELIFKVNHLDSIVALEQQVDLLTDLVKALINDSEQPSWSADYFTAITGHQAQDVRSVSDIISDLESHKTSVRSAQAEYLNSLA